MSGPETPVGGDPKVTREGLDDGRFTRRTFLKGAALTAGAAAAVGALGSEQLLGALEPAEGATAATPDALVRTGHSNNCDGVCGHLVHVRDGKVSLIEGADWEPTTIDGRELPIPYASRICVRGVCQQQNLYSADRIKYPYKRVGERGSGKWQRISWDEATTLIADNFKKTQDKYGKDSVWIAPYTGSMGLIEGVVGAGYRLASVTGASAGDFWGCNEGDSATPCGWNYVLANDPDANGGGIFDGHEATDFMNAEVIVLAGNNIAETALPDWRIICDARANGTKVVSIDPRFTPTSAGSDMWLPIRPGTDTALFDGIINHVIAHRLYDTPYLQSYTVAPFLVDPETKRFLRSSAVGLRGADDYVVVEASGALRRASDAKDPVLLGVHDAGGKKAATAFQILADRMAPYTPDKVAEITDLAAEDILALAKLWGESHPVAVRTGWALSHWYRGDLTMQAMLTLQALLGNIGVHGGGVTTFAGGLTTTAFDLPAWWAPTGTMFTVLEPMAACKAMLEDDPHPLRAAWFMIDNYAQQMTDRNLVVKALKSLDFLVVSDYVMTATADLADVVLPACTYLEKTDLLSSTNFYLQYMAKAVEPLYESRPDLEQVRLVAEKWGYGQYFDKSADEYLKEMLHIGDPDADANVNGLTWDQLTEGAYHLNTPTLPYVAFDSKEFPTMSGRIEFYVEMMLPYEQEVCDYKEQYEARPGNPLAKKYPLTFLSTHTRFRTHSQYCNLGWMNEITADGEGFLEVNPDDARARGIADGDVVRVFNDRGSMKVYARLTEAIKPGVVNCYQGGWSTLQVQQYIEGHPNDLTHQVANPSQSVIPNFPSNAAYYDCLVQVERA
jgi:molybdopterin-containing oxidoreductase family molybdopterin binding subunit